MTLSVASLSQAQSSITCAPTSTNGPLQNQKNIEPKGTFQFVAPYQFSKIDLRLQYDPNGTNNYIYVLPAVTGAGVDRSPNWVMTGRSWTILPAASMNPNFYGVEAKLYGTNRMNGTTSLVDTKTGAVP